MPTAGHGTETARILLVDRDAAAGQHLARTLEATLASMPSIAQAISGRQAVEQLRAQRADLLLVDLASLKDLSAAPEDGVARLVKLSAGALVIAISDGGSVTTAMAAMRAGAHDHLTRPLGGRSFVTRIREIAERHGKARALRLEARSDVALSFAGLVGASSQMQVVYEQIERTAASDSPAFITGESGTGKDRCAEALHARGPRASQRLVTLACGSIPRDRIEAELFGAVRGALSGADADQPGAAERADGGTLYLDEIGEMDLSVQAKLLRFLQTGTLSRLGETTMRRANVRVICSTGQNPMQLIADRKLREDLFYRLHVLPIHLPPLRQRPADIPVLAEHFLNRYAVAAHKTFTGFSAEAASLLIERDWPGNVGELERLIRRIVQLGSGGEVSAEIISGAEAGDRPATRAPGRKPILPMWRQEQRIIEEAIESFGGNIALAAQALELSPSTIYRKRQSWAEMEQNRGAA